MNSALAALIGLVLAIVLIIKKLSPVYSLMLGALTGGLLAGTGLVETINQMLSGVFSNTTVQKHQFFGAQPSSQSNSHIHT